MPWEPEIGSLRGKGRSEIMKEVVWQVFAATEGMPTNKRLGKFVRKLVETAREEMGRLEGNGRNVRNS